MSIHDGPGIRSTVFFKGCNLRCRWCHNPETWSSRRQLNHVAEKCQGCGRCAEACPSGVLSMAEGKLYIDRRRCTLTEACVEACLNGAISLIGKRQEPEQIVRSLLQDQPFFEESGGGVTLSGGEPLMQPEFAREILKLCREAGLHTALESNLAFPWETVEALLPEVDLWMCDLKVADRDRHKEWTGAYNDLVIGNLHNLSRRGVPLIVRTPVVPGVNDDEAAIEAICRLLEPLENLLYYELLGFHTLGFDKFHNLGLKNPMPEARPLDKELLERLKEIPGRYGLKSKKQYDGSSNL